MDASGQSGATVAESYLEGLISRGIKYVFANAGTDFAPTIEALLKAQETGREVPKFITVPHENVAMAMAHGYYRVSGDAAVVMVHVTPGTANAVCGIMNSSRDDTPILLVAGRTPITESGHPGSRGGVIHWGQEMFDQGSMVRDFVKWDYELRAGQPAEVVVGRALDIAMTDPKGPVYLTLPRETIAELADAFVATPDRPLGATPPAPDMDAIGRAAEMIADAQFPIILTSAGGREAEAFYALSDIAEAYSIPVGQPAMVGANLPSRHPMNFGTMPGDITARADVIVVIDSVVPWNTRAGIKDGAKVIQIAADPFYDRYPLRGFQADMAITASPAKALVALKNALADIMPAKAHRIDARAKDLQVLTEERDDHRAKFLKRAETENPVHPGWIAECVNRIKGEDDIVINELGSIPD
ncbi:MAG: hypothetical protein HQ503_10995, partial [Rhodospirillales bacterium]|nr:hypothetical protein [Rhodospirillales bacterium]